MAITWVGCRSRGGAIDPLTLDSLELYLLGDEVAGADGSSVATWPDLSSHSRDATQGTAGNRPLAQDGVSANGLRRMIEFDGSNDYMSGPFTASPGFDISAGVTIYVYCDELSLTTAGFNAQNIFNCGNNLSAFELYTRTSGALGTGFPDEEYGTNNGNVRDSYGATVLGPQLLTLQFIPPAGAAAEFKLYKNGVQMGTTQTNWQATGIRDGYTVGNTNNANEGFRGYIGAVLLFSTSHSNTTRVGVEQFLTDYFEG
jgi:hypothetical protein